MAPSPSMLSSCLQVLHRLATDPNEPRCRFYVNQELEGYEFHVCLYPHETKSDAESAFLRLFNERRSKFFLERQRSPTRETATYKNLRNTIKRAGLPALTGLAKPSGEPVICRRYHRRFHPNSKREDFEAMRQEVHDAKSPSLNRQHRFSPLGRVAETTTTPVASPETPIEDTDIPSPSIDIFHPWDGIDSQFPSQEWSDGGDGSNLSADGSTADEGGQLLGLCDWREPVYVLAE
eukprot:TRINITY_DN19138_c0_g1_i1.p1 TRINITY_DN19138_c0_g1~~TRINITY_DN19138_c0_g1_i1.p1  ORF type:complete len:235 (+),score=27.78 TRINITY_DN19138_c0_g1_i1:155-859(+)